MTDELPTDAPYYYPLGSNPKLNELMLLVAVAAANESGNGYDQSVIKRHADRAAHLWNARSLPDEEEYAGLMERLRDAEKWYCKDRDDNAAQLFAEAAEAISSLLKRVRELEEMLRLIRPHFVDLANTLPRTMPGVEKVLRGIDTALSQSTNASREEKG